MSFSNLTTQWQTDPGTVGFGSEKRHEKICRVHDAWPVILHKDLNATLFFTPSDRDVSLSFERRINSVVHQID